MAEAEDESGIFFNKLFDAQLESLKRPTFFYIVPFEFDRESKTRLCLEFLPVRARYASQNADSPYAGLPSTSVNIFAEAEAEAE